MVFGGMLVYYCDTPDRTDAASASAVIKGLYDARAHVEH